MHFDSGGLESADPTQPDGISRRRLIQAGGGMAAVALLGRGIPAFARDASVPAPDEVLGFPVGREAAGYNKIREYFEAVGAATGRVDVRRLETPTVEGRPIIYAIVTSERNHARLGEIAKRVRRLRTDPLKPAGVRREARSLPAFVNVFANVHGNEVSGADALLQVLYDLASRDDSETTRRLENLVVLLMPSQNPDGRETGRRTNSRGLDLNRDWFAKTQPETPEKVRLYSKYPPVLGMDLHEQFLSAPDTFFFPPNADPFHHEISRAGLRTLNRVISPAIEAAFDSKGYSYVHYGAYDQFAPIYGDTVPMQAYGAAGCLFEQENAQVYAEKFARQYLGTDTALGAIASDKDELLRRWARQWRTATLEGRQGRLLPNKSHEPGNSPKPLIDEGVKIYGYAFRPDRNRADLVRLVERLRSFDIEVHETTRAVKLSRLRPVGERDFGSYRLPRGSIVVTAAQPLKRFVHALLEDDPQAAVDAYYDVSGWSNPALMNLKGGAIGEPLGDVLGRAVLRRVDRARSLSPKPRKGAAAYAFALDATMSQAAAFALLGDGVKVERLDDKVARLPRGSALIPGSERSAAVAIARRHGVRLVPLGKRPPASERSPLRRPRVALIHDVFSDAARVIFASSSGYAEWLLKDRFGLDTQLMLATEVDAGALDDSFDALICPGGFSTVIPGGFPNLGLTPPGGGFGPTGLLAIQQFVSGGGTYIGYLQQGISVAMAAGIGGGVSSRPALDSYVVPGSPFKVRVSRKDPATRTMPRSSWVFNFRDPILQGGERTLLSYPQQLRHLGFAEGTGELEGSVAATVARIGSGRSYVLSHDPAFRGWVEASQSLVGNALLTPPEAGGGEARDVDASLLDAARGYERKIVIRARGGEAERILERAATMAAELDVTGSPRLRGRGSGLIELQAPDPEPLSGHTPGWVHRAVSDLRRAGIQPELIVA